MGNWLEHLSSTVIDKRDAGLITTAPARAEVTKVAV